MMNCENCTHRPDPVPFAVHESAMARAERAHRRLWIVVLVLIVLLAGSNGAWIWYESQMEVTETSNYEIEQDSSDGGTNYAVGGDFYGEAENQNHENENTNP